jgi:hypothetical protein
MNVGIYARYQPRETTYAAIRVAQLARQFGNQVSFLATTPRRGLVHADWDDRVLRDVRFTDWAETLDTIIWLECPLIEQVLWSRRARKGRSRRRVILIASPHDSEVAIRQVYPAFDSVVAPSDELALGLLQGYGLKTVLAAPWSPGLPVTVRRGAHGPLRLHFLLWEPPYPGSDVTALAIIGNLLAAQVDIAIHVTLNSRSGETVRYLGRHARADGRMTFSRGSDFETLLLAFGDHDLTVDVTPANVFGILPLCSLHAGTPTIVADGMVARAIIADGRYGACVPAGDPAEFLAAIDCIVVCPDLLDRMREGCPAWLRQRARDFEGAWATLLSDR